MTENTDTTEQQDEFFEEQTFRADPGQEPLRIDKFLFDKMRKVSRNRIQNAVKSGAITVDGKLVKPNFKIKPGHEILAVIPRYHDEDTGVIPENIPLDIVYEDEDLLVVNKPSGLVVHPGIGNRTGTLVNALTHYLQTKQGPVMDGNAADRPFLVHRIDKDTSGLLVVGKNEYAISHLAKQFARHTVHRRYQALVWGEPEERIGKIEIFIGRDPKNRTQQTVFREEEAGKQAITHYRVIESMYYVSVVECQLETGRTHQIRVHMKHLGHPLFNDEKYGGNRVVKGTVYSKYRQFVENCFTLCPRQALHAKELGFEHPKSGKMLMFDSPLPDDMQGVLEKWRSYVASRRSL